MRRTCFSP
uniref:Uncharacterized protein n=1 Tax=Anguilla anguilla TaxID=7936 RepID=A0A0E9TKH7_ANGAN